MKQTTNEWWVWKYHNGRFDSHVGPMDHNSAENFAARLRKVYGPKNWTYSVEPRPMRKEETPVDVIGVG